MHRARDIRNEEKQKYDFSNFMFLVNLRLRNSNLQQIENIVEPVSIDQFNRIIKTLADVACKEIDTAYLRGYMHAKERGPIFVSTIMGFSLGTLTTALLCAFLYFY